MMDHNIDVENMVSSLLQSSDDVEKILEQDQTLGQKKHKKITKKHHKNQHKAKKALREEKIAYLTEKK